MGIFNRKKEPTFADDIFCYVSAILAELSDELDKEGTGITLQVAQRLHLVGTLMYYLAQATNLEYVQQVVSMYCEQNFDSDSRASAEYVIRVAHSKAVKDANSIIDGGGNINDIFEVHARLTCRVMNLEVSQYSIDFFTYIFADFFNHVNAGKQVWNI